MFHQLRAPEAYARHFAKRSLVDQWVPEELDARIAKLDKTTADFDQARLEALWLQQTWDDVDLKLVESLLGSKDHHVRAAAVRAAGSLVANEASLYERIATRLARRSPPSAAGGGMRAAQRRHAGIRRRVLSSVSSPDG